MGTSEGFVKKIISKLERSTKTKIFKKDREDDKRTKVSLKANAEGSGYSGSGYNAKGSADHGKIISNRKRR